MKKFNFFLSIIFVVCIQQITNAQPYSSIFGNEKTQFNILEYCHAFKKSNILGTTTKFYVEKDTIIEQEMYKKITCEERWFYDHSGYLGIRQGKIIKILESQSVKTIVPVKR